MNFAFCSLIENKTERLEGWVDGSKYLMNNVTLDYQRSYQCNLSATGALATVARLSRTAKSEYVQLEASKDLLDRAGYKPIDRSQVQIAGDIKVSIDLS